MAQLAGILQERKHLIWGGIAVIVILVIAFSSAGTPKPAKIVSGSLPVSKPVAPDQAKAFLAEINKRTDDVARAQARAEEMKADAERMADQSGHPIPATGTPVAVVRPEKDSNIALSFRAGSKPTDEKSELKNLIESERTALAQNIAASERAFQPALKAAEKPQDKTEVAPLKTKDPVTPEELTLADGKKYRVFEDQVIESVLVNRLNGSFTGPVIVQVSSPVYSHDNEHVLIPQGSRVLGEAARVGSQGQERLAVTFHRLIMPDGFSVNLDKFMGLNQIGEAGLKDKVDHHYGQIFGTSIALGLVSGFSLVGTRGYNAGGIDQYRQGVSSSVGQSSEQVLSRQLNILPNITIREGHRVRVVLRQDLELPAYESHRVPGDI